MRFLRRLALRFVLLTVRRPWTTLSLAGVALAGCVLLGIFKLPVSAEQNNLFAADVPFFRDYLQFVKLFPENDAVYLILEPADPKVSPPLARWMAAADAVVARMHAIPTSVSSASAGIRVDALGDQGLLFEDPAALPERLAVVKKSGLLLKVWGEKPDLLTARLGTSPTERFLSLLNASRLLGFLGAAPPDAESAPLVGEIARSWDAALADPNGPLKPGTTLPDLTAVGATTPRDLGYNFVPDQTDPSRNLLLIQVFPKENYTSLTAASETVDVIRSAAAESMRSFPEFKLGVTGRPALEADEMRTTDRDGKLAEICALSAVFLGLVLMLRSLWLAVAAELCLGVGIGWTFGWASVSVGELNLLSTVFLIALIGIGMDYIVQILSRYRREVSRRGGPRTLWISVFRQVAAPITTACLGAAGAFLVSVLTPFKGAADLGVIAGGGLVLCLVSGFVVLPPLLTIFPMRRRKLVTGPQTFPPATDDCHPDERGEEGSRAGESAGFSKAFVTSRFGVTRGRRPNDPAPHARRWLLAPAVWVALLLALTPFALRSKFDPGLLNLQAPDLDSVKLVRKLQSWSAVVLSKDADVLRRARAAVEGSPLVDKTESILSGYDNADWLRAYSGELPQVKWSAPDPVKGADLPRLVDNANALATRYESSSTAAKGEAAATLLRAAGGLRNLARRLSDDVIAGRGDASAARLSAWQNAFAPQLRRTLGQFNPGPLDLTRVPTELRSHLVAGDGTMVLYIYPKQDLWQQENLDRFAEEIEHRLTGLPGVPPPTGLAINLHHSTQSVRDSFLRATSYALVLIVVLVIVDLRRLGQTLLAFSVLGFGLPMLVGLMGLLGATWNFANFFALPILIGAGHEYGIFMVHRYREAVANPRKGWRGWDVSDWALLLCAYVTTAAFGFFWLLAHHRGLKSLGLVMALGTACIYLATVAVLRPILKSRLARREDAGTSGATKRIENGPE